jgi:hypothetical protein
MAKGLEPIRPVHEPRKKLISTITLSWSLHRMISTLEHLVEGYVVQLTMHKQQESLDWRRCSFYPFNNVILMDS